MRINSRISLIVQEAILKKTFPGCNTRRYREESLVWIHDITPSPLSETYRLKLTYKRNEGVKVYVVCPKPLTLAEGKTKLPHVYSTPEQRLCLYYPNRIEWNESMLYSSTIIPWACEWLVHYECWVGTGKWKGGGIGHEDELETLG